MSKPVLTGSMELPKEVVIVDDHGGRKLYLLSCSRRKLLALLDAAEGRRGNRLT